MTAKASATAGARHYQPCVARMIAPVAATPAAAAASAMVSQDRCDGQVPIFGLAFTVISVSVSAEDEGRWQPSLARLCR
jgi:hypothetical protein